MLNVLDLISTNYGTFEVCYMYLKLLLTSYLLDLALSTFTNKTVTNKLPSRPSAKYIY